MNLDNGSHESVRSELVLLPSVSSSFKSNGTAYLRP